MSWVQPVYSTMIAEVGYDSDRSVLTVRFNKGGIWEYSGVDEGVALDLANAPSVGSMFLSEIKPSYAARRVG
jgi:hypothetical protein